MGNTLLAVVAMIYCGVALDYFLKYNYAMAVVFVAYAISNVGFIAANGK